MRRGLSGEVARRLQEVGERAAVFTELRQRYGLHEGARILGDGTRESPYVIVGPRWFIRGVTPGHPA